MRMISGERTLTCEIRIPCARICGLSIACTSDGVIRSKLAATLSRECSPVI